MKYETVIGLEVHVELKTNSKIFSNAPVAFGSEPNTLTSVVDLGYPGVLPVINHRAIEYGMKACLALNCQIAPITKFDRKNYFYPDNPKAYQISQFDQPIGEHGYVDIEVNGVSKRIGITRIHLEEDAGKLTHTYEGSLVDFNRQGTPLIEIVSEPEISSPEEAYAYLEKIKSIIQYTEVSDCKMEEGSLRCDANISLRPVGETELGTKTELKNLNSFAFVQKGLEYEQARQETILRSGGKINQETRRFDEATKTTVLMRTKEGSDDYRYFPEPDLVPIIIDDAWKETIRKTIPELPDARKKRYVEQLGLPQYDANVLTTTKAMSDFFDETVLVGADAKAASNWLMGEISAYMNANNLELSNLNVTPATLAALIALIDKGTISTKIAKNVCKTLMEKGGEPEAIVKEQGLGQISDATALVGMINEVLDANPQSIEDFKGGKQKATGFLVGQLMKLTKGQANPQLLNQLLLEEITKR